jgi:hypothetical protein
MKRENRKEWITFLIFLPKKIENTLLLYMKHFLLLISLLFSQFLTYANNESQITKPPPKFRVGAQVGYAYISAPILIDTPSGLRNSLSFGADLSYFFAKGIGPLKGNLGGGIKYVGTHSEGFETHYVGIFFAGRSLFGKNKHCVFGNIGAGYVRYGNDIEIIKEYVANIGNLFGLHAEAGYDFMITPSFAIGLQASFTFGFAKYTFDKFGAMQQRAVSHLDISVGFRFYQ